MKYQLKLVYCHQKKKSLFSFEQDVIIIYNMTSLMLINIGAYEILSLLNRHITKKKFQREKYETIVRIELTIF